MKRAILALVLLAVAAWLLAGMAADDPAAGVALLGLLALAGATPALAWLGGMTR